MITMQISIDTLDKVKFLVSLVSGYSGQFYLLSGQYIINAKSIVGIFSLDWSKPVVLRMCDVDREEEFSNALKAAGICVLSEAV